MILASFGIKDDEAWRMAGASLMVAIAANTGLAVGSSRRMSAEARSSLSPMIWRVSLGSSVLFFVWNGLNLMSWPRPLSFGPVVAGMAWFLVLASVMSFACCSSGLAMATVRSGHELGVQRRVRPRVIEARPDRGPIGHCSLAREAVGVAALW